LVSFANIPPCFRKSLVPTMRQIGLINDLKRGDSGIDALLQVYTNLKKTDGKCGDLMTSSGELIEVKTDFYDPNKYLNFIIETGSNKRQGGPWLAAEHECDYFLYFFAKTSEVFLFRVSELVQRCDHLIETTSPLKGSADSGNWITKFYRIPRREFSDIRIVNCEEILI
jgi:hypothetical protein